MILLNIFGSALGILQVSLVLCLFARYIYLEKGFSSLKQLKLFWGIAAGFLWSVQHVRKSLDLWKTIFC